jgi:hypothetical protein
MERIVLNLSKMMVYIYSVRKFIFHKKEEFLNGCPTLSFTGYFLFEGVLQFSLLDAKVCVLFSKVVLFIN